LVWALFTRVEEIARADGKVAPASREQLIQSLEGGILEELSVQEGDIVEKGQILLKIDPTRAGASYGESLSKVQGLKGSIARLRADAYDTPLTFPPDIAVIESIVRDDTQGYSARLKRLNESGESLEWSLRRAHNEGSLSEPLACRGLMLDVE
ncbi:biotin/lipoyl-binding protein, partial [Enterobacter quasiroggenkampii]|uniref:biotin/lipoyl-binding protein n=1 Tax=Enterobacter quasiroggenkampii TaxID=2497436 RepID=UPI0021D315E3